jgi:hypothetical protein
MNRLSLRICSSGFGALGGAPTHRHRITHEVSRQPEITVGSQRSRDDEIRIGAQHQRRHVGGGWQRNEVSRADVGGELAVSEHSNIDRTCEGATHLVLSIGELERQHGGTGGIGDTVGESHRGAS